MSSASIAGPGPRPVRAARGTTLSTLGWQQEAALRMLQNNLDPEVAERPDDLVVYGGTGKAARDWASFDALVRTLTTLKADETMLVQSGRPVGVMQTHEWAPRVLIANSNLVGDWATWPEFRRLEALGLMMYGQMTAGSWIYIGTQGILQGTYETFSAIANKRFGGTLAGTLTLTGGAGGMGGAQPLAITMNDGVCLCVDVDSTRLQRRVDHRYLDVWCADLDEAIKLALDAKKARKALSIGVLGNAATIFPELLRRGVEIDIVTDQTSAHDPLSYLPEGIEVDDWHFMAEKDPEDFTLRARASMVKQVEAMVGFMDAGVEVFDYGNSIRGEAKLGGYDRAFAFPGFVPAYIRPLFCEGKGPFRWAALSGNPKDIAATDKAVLELFPDNEPLARWMKKASEKVAFQGLPARICWLGYGERHLAGERFNDMV
ncbi:MAG: urocanate hydratase, partial [Actinobacteria bacterium]|nr:urocanate hydratase [Actinomycetota bacterium]